MSFFSKVFGRKKTITSVILNTQSRIFEIYSVSHPTDAQKMKASFYICISGIAILNHFGNVQMKHGIDNLVNETRDLTKSLTVKVSELANNMEQLEKITSGFPSDTEITESTNVNGLAAFDAMYFSMGHDLMNDILMHSKGPMGLPGYASIVVADGIFGEGESKDKFMEISMELLNFTKELAKAI